MALMIFTYILLLMLFAASYGMLGVGIFNLLWITVILLRKKDSKKE